MKPLLARTSISEHKDVFNIKNSVGLKERIKRTERKGEEMITRTRIVIDKGRQKRSGISDR